MRMYEKKDGVAKPLSNGAFAQVVNNLTSTDPYKCLSANMGRVLNDKLVSANDILTDKADKTQITNPNLIDNGWFTINQRGQTAYEGLALNYCVDRWRGNTNRTTYNVEVVDGGVIIDGTNCDAHAEIIQILELTRRDILNKPITLSFMADGEIFSTTVVDDGSRPYRNIVSANHTTLNPIWNRPIVIARLITANDDLDDNLLLWVETPSGNRSPIINAVKLEVGSVSTLAMDIAPNYAEELLKCQRYYISYGETAYNAFGCIGGDSTKYEMGIYLPCEMRTIPSVQMTKWVGRLAQGGYSSVSSSGGVAPSSLSVASMSDNEISITDTRPTASSDLNNSLMGYQIYGLTLSADL